MVRGFIGRLIVGTCLVLAASSGTVLAASSGTGKADDTPARQPPPGKRIFFSGNSWFIFVPWGMADLVKAAGIEGHEALRAAKPGDISLIEEGKVDVYAHGVHWWTEPIRDAEKVLVPGLKANPDFRMYFHAAWLVGDGRHAFPEGRRDPVKVTEDYDATNPADLQAAMDKTRKGVEAAADGLNEKFGKPGMPVVFIVPVGDAVVKLREMVVAGSFPGVQKQSALWSDAMPHAGPLVSALSGYCHFAAIYRMSPAGLKIERFKEITDEQHAILQRIAWETVSRYPYAGVPADRGK